MISNSRKGTFLGFIPNTMKNILWYDVETKRVKIAKHAQFDEGMNDLQFKSLPPNAIHMQWVRQGTKLPMKDGKTTVGELVTYVNLFSCMITKTLKVRDGDKDCPSFGLNLIRDEINNQVFVSSIEEKSSAQRMFSTPKAANNAIRGA
jgi:hypothetical protein